MNKNTKFAIGASIALVVLFGTVLGATYGITKAFEKDEDKVVFHIADKEYRLEDIKYDPIDKSREAESNELSADEQADILMTEFYSMALFGTTNYVDLTGVQADNFVFKDGNEWNRPELLDTAGIVEFKEDFVNMKFLKETTNTSISDYLLPLAENNSEIKELLKGMVEDKTLGMNYFQLSAETTSTTTIGMIVEALSRDASYQKEVFEDMFTYAYLWQDAREKAYDYNFTKYLVNADATISNEYHFDANENSLSGIADLKDKTELDAPVDATTWNGLATSLTDYMTDDTYLNTLGTDYFNGFTGIQFGKNTLPGVKDDYNDIQKTWNITDETANVPGGEATTIVGNYSSEDMLKNANYYIASGKGDESNGEGAILVDKGDFGSLKGPASLVAYTQLSPYIFGEMKETSQGDNFVTNIEYSMYAKNDGTNLTAGTKDDSDEYLFERWFGTDAAMGEIYVAEGLVEHDSSLVSASNNYWYDKGFYIELSGASSDKYLSFIPSELVFKE